MQKCTPSSRQNCSAKANRIEPVWVLVRTRLLERRGESRCQDSVPILVRDSGNRHGISKGWKKADREGVPSFVFGARSRADVGPKCGALLFEVFDFCSLVSIHGNIDAQRTFSMGRRKAAKRMTGTMLIRERKFTR